MKRFYLILITFVLICMLIIPISAMNDGMKGQEESTSPLIQKEEQADFKVLLKDSGEVLSLSAEEYIFGVLACEMPANYPDEAIKAQAVASFTVACYQKMEQSENPNADLKGADISDDPTMHQGFISKEAAKEKWGDHYEDYANKFKKLIESVKNKVITYEGELINAAYYAISSGKTETAAAVWGSDVPYLQAVDSVGDLLAPDYLTTKSFTVDEFKEAASGLGITLEGEDPAAFLSEPVRTDSGMVATYTLGGTEVSGQQMRSAFSLRSANFDLAYEKDVFTFTVRGYGHDVGMSQFGAKCMAEEGSNYEEVLLWYYTGCKLENFTIQ